MQTKREQCRETVCERSDVKPLDSAELSAPTGKLDKSKIGDASYLTHFQAKLPSLAGTAASESPPPFSFKACQLGTHANYY